MALFFYRREGKTSETAGKTADTSERRSMTHRKDEGGRNIENLLLTKFQAL